MRSTPTRRGRELGGNQMYAVDKADTDTRVQAYDKIWVKHIKSALMENRFRLVQQPIASLLGEDKGMFDVLVRMLDEQGNEVLPAEFIAAAERNDLMKNIDRWVIGASMSFAANRKATCIFVRVSKDTILDKSLIGWLETQLKSLKIEPKRLCIQVTEELATQYVRQTKELADNLRKLGFRFAIEHFGTGRDPLKLLTDIGMNFIKVDGSLMQGLSTNQLQQQRVKGLVEAAKRKGVETVAERVEDANTMAVLWQLGIEFIQGYFVNAPEDVTMSGERHQKLRSLSLVFRKAPSLCRRDLEPIDLLVRPGESLPALALLVLELLEILVLELHRRTVAAVDGQDFAGCDHRHRGQVLVAIRGFLAGNSVEVLALAGGHFLDLRRRQRQHFAVVVDEHGDAQGIAIGCAGRTRAFSGTLRTDLPFLLRAYSSRSFTLKP